MEYHSAIKKNKIMPLAATWMDLEIVKCSEVSQKEEKYILTHVMWNGVVQSLSHVRLFAVP